FSQVYGHVIKHIDRAGQHISGSIAKGRILNNGDVGVKSKLLLKSFDEVLAVLDSDKLHQTKVGQVETLTSAVNRDIAMLFAFLQMLDLTMTTLVRKLADYE